MGAALGAGLGALLGVAGGYEKAQAEKRQNANAAFLDLAMKNPSVFASDPALLKEVGKRTSPEFADLLGHIGQHQAQALAQGGRVFGGAPATAPPALGGGGPQRQQSAGPPSDVNVLRQELAQADQFMQGPAWASIDPIHQKIFTAKYEQWSKTLQEMEKEQREPGVAAARVTAEKKAGLAPDIVAGEAAAAAKKSGAEAGARLGVETSPAAISGAASKAAAEESARLAVTTSKPAIDAAVKKAVAVENAKRETAASAPLSPKDKSELASKLETRITHLVANYSAIHPKPALYGKDKWSADFKSYVAKQDPEAAAHMFNVPVGSVYGASATKGPGWKAPDGSFIPDED